MIGAVTEKNAALFPEEFARRYRAAGYWNEDTLATWLPQAAAAHPDAPALVGHDLAGQEVRWTYAELLAAVRSTAAALAEHGIGRDDFVLVQLPNVVEYFRVVFAVFYLGAHPVFALPAHRGAELTHFLRETQAAALVTTQARGGVDFPAIAAEVIASLGADTQLIVCGEDALEEDPRGVDKPAEVDPESLAFLQVSGGTTGIPKLIPRAHADYLYSVRESNRICHITQDTRMLVVLPVSHNFTMSSPGILGVIGAGGCCVLTEDPTPTSVFRLIDAEKITYTCAVPPLAMMWLQMRPRIDATLDTLEELGVGGAKFTPEAAARVRPVLGCRLRQVFGMAEGLVNYTRNEDPDELVVGTQGRPISPDDEILILDDEGNPVPDSERGNLFTRGPYTIRGYFHGADPGSFTPDGFYRTGDIVRQLPSGHLVVEGRDKDQINRGGEKISAEEIENHLIAHPAVIDAALVAVPDDYLGERSCAYVISAETPTAADLRDFLRERGVATYKIPDRFEFADSFPLTGVGKISRKALRRKLAALLTDTETQGE